MTYPLVTPRLRIRPLALEDVPSFVAYRQNPDVARYQSWETSYAEANAVELVESQIGVDVPADGEWLQLAIHERETGVHVGDLALHSVSDEESVYEIGYTIAPAHQGQGFAREAASRLLEFLFTENRATSVIAMTDTRNAPSIRLLEALGFEHVPSKGFTEEFKGETVDVDYFELTREGNRDD